MAFRGRISKWNAKLKIGCVTELFLFCYGRPNVLCILSCFFFVYLWTKFTKWTFFFSQLLEQVRKQMTKAEQEPTCYLLLSHHVSWLWWSTCIFAHCSSLNNVPDPQAPEDHFFNFLFFFSSISLRIPFLLLSPSSLVHSKIKCVNLGEDFCLLSSIHYTSSEIFCLLGVSSYHPVLMLFVLWLQTEVPCNKSISFLLAGYLFFLPFYLFKLVILDNQATSIFQTHYKDIKVKDTDIYIFSVLLQPPFFLYNVYHKTHHKETE